MARLALKIKQKKLLEQLEKKKADPNHKFHIAKFYNRCQRCGRVGSYIREYGVCRVCFRNLAREWLIMWVKKASW